MYAFPLLRAKVQCPPLRAATLHRDRLLDWLEANVHRRVMFVVADPGYGKTTLLADFSRRSRLRTLWYRLDQDDANWVSFVHYLVAAGREFDPGFAPNTEALLKDLGTAGPSREAIVDTFLRELPSLVATGPAVLILDDYHLVDEASDVRDIMRELVARAPEGLSLVVLSRRDPALPVARAKVRGEFSTLDTDDLRFRTDETDELFRHTYSRALDPDVVVELSRRTEGWPASLQLVETALRGRSPSDARSFVANLNGASGELYDYLAEEVVGDLDEASQRFLMRTSLLQAVDAELASLLVEVEPAVARELMTRAERLGLLARRGKDSPEVFRYHPLVRDFLETRLRRDDGDAAVAALHRRVAAYAEGRDWHIAAYHYAAAGSTADLHRVLADSTQTIMGSGEYALVEKYISSTEVNLPPALEIALSRMDFERGRLDEALAKAERAHARLASSPDRKLGELALANFSSINYLLGNAARAYELSKQLSAVATDRTLSLIAQASVAIINTSTSGNLAECDRLLRIMAADQRAAHQGHYLGVTLLNLGGLERARGNAESALQLADEAIGFLVGGSTNAEVDAARTLRAWALAHLGDWAKADLEMTQLLAEVRGSHRGELLVEWAEILTQYGGAQEANRALAEAATEQSLVGDARFHLPTVQAEFAIRIGRLDQAKDILAEHERVELCALIANDARKQLLRGYLAAANSAIDATDVLVNAQRSASQQGATFYERCSRTVLMTLLDTEHLNSELVSLPTSEAVYLSVVAEAVCERLGDLSEAALAVVESEAKRRPERWRDSLRRKIDGAGETGVAAASLLEHVGSQEDIARLRNLARRMGTRAGGASYGRDLARRLAPRVFVEDEGRVRVIVGGQPVQELEVRRKVLALLCFLITRPGLSATRDEVLEALWPDAEPSAGVNSLNQTIYFLRRVLENPYVEDRSPGYVHNVSDVLWLDKDLVSSRSIESRQILDELSRKPSIDVVQRLSDQYRGRFALDFAYEEWASGYRDHLHAAYLEAIEQAVLADSRSDQHGRAVALIRRALAIDSSAEQLEKQLLRLYHQAGSHAAAAEQFSHYSALVREELGVEPPTLDEIVSD